MIGVKKHEVRKDWKFLSCGEPNLWLKSPPMTKKFMLGGRELMREVRWERIVVLVGYSGGI